MPSQYPTPNTAAPQPFSNNYDIPKGGYLAFDAMSLRQLILDRLNEQGTYTDQNYLGSNLASIIDIVAYSYHTLIYYLNRTATESAFTEAQLYENMNRIVKTIDYSPIGSQTCTLNFNCSAENLIRGHYTIPRYSYILIDSIPFSFNEDIVFAKTTDYTSENLDELSQQKLLFQGLYNEYPIYTATGNTNELLILNTATQTVDHFNIDVYVKSVNTNKWTQYSKTPNFYLEDGLAEKYEIRLNGNGRYEIKFGDNINGKQLTKGDQVAVYYLVSNREKGEVSGNTGETDLTLIVYNQIQYNQILLDINKLEAGEYLTQSQSTGLKFRNTSSATSFQEKETVEDIRKNAPGIYRSQYRLVTTSDYEAFVKTNFDYLLADIKAVNNQSYVFEYLKYFYDLGINNPSSTEQALLNQVQYSNSCNFNNIYLVVAPRASKESLLNYITPAQKELIKSIVEPTKMSTAEINFIDPVYKVVALGVQTDITEQLFSDDNDILANLLITKKQNSRRSDKSIVVEVANIFKKYFSKDNLKLGQLFDIRLLTQQILQIPEIETISTTRVNNPAVTVQGLSFYVWNPLYPERDALTTQNNLPTKFFEYLYFSDLVNIANYIKVVDSVNKNSIY